MLGTVGNKNDADLVPANIKDGVDIFGVEGTLTQGTTPVTGTKLGYYNPDIVLDSDSNVYNLGVTSTKYYIGDKNYLFDYGFKYNGVSGYIRALVGIFSDESVLADQRYSPGYHRSTFRTAEVYEDTTNVYFFTGVTGDSAYVGVVTVNKATDAITITSDSGTDGAWVDARMGINIPLATLVVQPGIPPIDLTRSSDTKENTRIPYIEILE